MQSRYSNALPAVAGLLALSCGMHAQAGGLLLYGPSLDNAGLSNAGVAARAQGPDTISGNIAGLTYVKGT